MKPLVLLIAFLALLSPALRAQDSSRTRNVYGPVSLKDFYNAKADRYRNKGWVLLGTGGALFFVSSIVASATPNNADQTVPGIVALTGLTGSILMLSSIPSFIMAGHYRHKAMNASVGLNFSHGAPGVAIKIPL